MANITNYNALALANTARGLIHLIKTTTKTIKYIVNEWNVCVEQSGYTGTYDFPFEYTRKAHLVADLERCANQLDAIAHEVPVDASVSAPELVTASSMEMVEELASGLREAVYAANEVKEVELVEVIARDLNEGDVVVNVVSRKLQPITSVRVNTYNVVVKYSNVTHVERFECGESVMIVAPNGSMLSHSEREAERMASRAVANQNLQIALDLMSESKRSEDNSASLAVDEGEEQSLINLLNNIGVVNMNFAHFNEVEVGEVVAMANTLIQKVGVAAYIKLDDRNATNRIIEPNAPITRFTGLASILAGAYHSYQVNCFTNMRQWLLDVDARHILALAEWLNLPAASEENITAGMYHSELVNALIDEINNDYTFENEGILDALFELRGLNGEEESQIAEQQNA